MSFFKSISIKLASFLPFFLKNDKVATSYNIKKKKEKIDKIVSKQKLEREKVIHKEGETLKRVSALTSKQIDLVKQKTKIQSKKNNIKEVFNIETLEIEIELLKTNLQLQKNNIFISQPIPSETIEYLKKELIHDKIPQISILKTLQENREIIKNLRKEDKNHIIKKREDIFKFSLIELFKERERIKEIERIELQKIEEKRIQNLKFDEAIKRAKNRIKNYDFDKAEAELKNALSINYLRHKVVNNLKNEILRLKSHFEKQRAEFDKVFERANIQLMNKDYQNALKNFNQSKLYDINTKEVNEKIQLVEDHILKNMIKKENFFKDKNLFNVEIENKRFIKAKRILDTIIKKSEGKEVEIEKLKQLFARSKSDHKEVKNKYKLSLVKAEKLYLNGDLTESIRVFKTCLNLDIDNKYCDKRIREIKHKQDLEVKKQKLLELKAKQEKLRITELNKFKEEKEEILSLLRRNGITKFYHFTDESNIASIIDHAGLYSWFYCENNGIEINRPGGDSTSKELDWQYDLHNFVRLSFAKNHPMKFFAKKEGRLISIRNLEIDIETATFKNTQFSDVNATKKGHQVGNDLVFLENNIRFDVVKQPNQFNLSDEEKPFYQAEIMVEEHIELKYITNL